MADRKTIVFFPEGAYGPTNNCAGIGAVLRARGHRVVFILEESFAGSLEKRGFEERLMRLGPPPAEPEVPGQFWIDFIRDTAPVFRKPTLEQLGEFIAPTFQALIDLLNSFYGLNLTGDDVTALGKQILKTERDFNFRAGFTAQQDRLPDFFKKEPLAPHNLTFTVKDEDLDTLFNW